MFELINYFSISGNSKKKFPTKSALGGGGSRLCGAHHPKLRLFWRHPLDDTFSIIRNSIPISFMSSQFLDAKYLYKSPFPSLTDSLTHCLTHSGSCVWSILGIWWIISLLNRSFVKIVKYFNTRIPGRHDEQFLRREFFFYLLVTPTLK